MFLNFPGIRVKSLEVKQHQFLLLLQFDASVTGTGRQTLRMETGLSWGVRSSDAFFDSHLRSSWFLLVHRQRNLWPETSVFRSGGYNSEVEIQWSRRQWPHQDSELVVLLPLLPACARWCICHVLTSKRLLSQGCSLHLGFPASRARGHINFWSL